MSKNGFDKTTARFASFALALMLGACAQVGQQDAKNNGDSALDAAATTNAQPAVQMVAQPVPPVTVKVRRGDSLASIARSHQVNVQSIVEWNHLKSPRLRFGQTLIVSSPGAVRMVAVPVAPASAAASASASASAPASSAATAAAGPAPSAAESREVSAELARHAKSVSLMWPAQGSVVEGFQPGETRGIEIGGTAGDPVRAAADGKVMYAGTGLNEYGSLIIVQHNKDYLTAYAHNRRLLVRTGDIVRKGQQIAEMGSENNSRVSVLFELRHDGKPVDPMPFLPRQRS
jgi:lipoprotein NlpD